MRDLLVYAPYLDVDLYDFLTSLPASVLIDRTLHTEVIARAWPHVADVPYGDGQGVATGRRSGRALGAAVATIVQRLGTTWIRLAAVLPAIAATVLDGNAGRLWAARLLFYIGYIAELASSGSGGMEPP